MQPELLALQVPLALLAQPELLEPLALQALLVRKVLQVHPAHLVLLVHKV